MLKLPVVAVLACTLGLFVFAGPAQAQRDPPYCAYTGGANGYENCGYFTLRQCLDAVSGVGGHCRVNPRVTFQPSWTDQPRDSRARQRDR